MLPNMLTYPVRAVVRFADWPEHLRKAVHPDYVHPAYQNDCPARVNPGGTVTIHSYCLLKRETVTIPAWLCTIHNHTPMTRSAPEADPERPAPEHPDMPLDPTFSEFLEALPA